jgi:GDP-L-fucose synthase
MVLVDCVDNELVNIGAGDDESIRGFAAAICRIVDYPADRIEYDTTRYVGAVSKCLNVEKLRSLHPAYAPRALGEGLASTIAWFYESKAYLQ